MASCAPNLRLHRWKHTNWEPDPSVFQFKLQFHSKIELSSISLCLTLRKNQNNVPNPGLENLRRILSLMYHKIPNNISARFRKLDQRFKSAEGLLGLHKLYPAVQCPATLRPTAAPLGGKKWHNDQFDGQASEWSVCGRTKVTSSCGCKRFGESSADCGEGTKPGDAVNVFEQVGAHVRLQEWDRTSTLRYGTGTKREIQQVASVEAETVQASCLKDAKLNRYQWDSVIQPVTFWPISCEILMSRQEVYASEWLKLKSWLAVQILLHV